MVDMNDYSIRIGEKELLSRVNEPDKDKQEKAFEDVITQAKIRISTLLKTDNLSFLFGAGASMEAGGISLGSISPAIERALLADGLKGNRLTKWLNLFYEIINRLIGNSIDPKKKKSEFDSKTDNEMTPLNINFECLLSHICLLEAGVTRFSEKAILRGKGKKDFHVELKAIKALRGKLIRQLIMHCNLPVEGKSIQTHRQFLKKVLTRPLNLRRANLFTLNYDTLIEQAADAEGAVLVDGFVGSLDRVFRPESYNLDYYFPAETTEGRVHRFDRALHLYKLHGSINWRSCEPAWENPHGLKTANFDPDRSDDDVMIYPTPLKYGQTLDLPYSELFRRFGNAIVQPQSVLFTVGYGFGDDHVNAIIRQALTIPSFTLVIVDPNPSSYFAKQLKEQKDERVWIVSGEELGTFGHFVNQLMPDLQEESIQSKVISTYNSLKKREDADKTSEEGKDGQ